MPPYIQDDDENDEREGAEFVTFSFKCRVGRDDDLIRLLRDELGRKNRSGFIRRKLRLALGMDDQADPGAITLADLRAELAPLLDAIQNATVIAEPAPEKPSRKRKDVNEFGDNIPTF